VTLCPVNKRKFEKFFVYLEPDSFVVLGIERDGKQACPVSRLLGRKSMGLQGREGLLQRRWTCQ
jgi:hypothetical protein